MKQVLKWHNCVVIVTAQMAAVYFHGTLDALWRGPYAAPAWQHLLAAGGLYTAIGALSGLALWGCTRLERGLARRLLPDRAWGVWLRAVFYGFVALLFSYPTALWTFSGAGVSRTFLAWAGPPLFLLLVLSATALLARWVLRVIRDRAFTRQRAVLCASSFMVGIALVVVDQYFFVALYARLHSYLELTALILFMLAVALIVDVLASSRLKPLFSGLTALGLLVSLVFVVSHQARDQIDEGLTHAWIDPVYVGRMLRRAQEVEAFISDPAGYDGIQMGRVERLKRRYGLADSELDEQWLQMAEAVTPYPASTVSPATTGPLNVLIYYIDTLRFDVADDASIMPNVARFRAQSLDFSSAYATGSDTLRSLPAITGGNYFVRNEHAGDLCKLAAASSHESSLFIAQSAREFLRRLRPAFKFEHEVEMADYESGRDVWGYGADRATSDKIVDAALEYLGKLGPQPFFMWLFHFDQHNWREIEDSHVDEVMQRHDVPAEGELNSRYRAIATAIDADFGRMLKGLERLGLEDNTVVLLVSDHGEGLGEGGFWVHSVFLWESLIHVPLALRVPGIPAKSVSRPVSLVDVAPTLSRFLESPPQPHLYHGEDLLLHAWGKPAERRLPILFAAALRDELVRVGTLDESGEYKLVVRLEAAQLELHERSSSKPDDTNLSRERPELSRALLQQLATSPVFPRNIDDFRMLKPKGPLDIKGGNSVLPVSAAHQ